MTKGIQAMKQFKRERTMLELTAATASYHQLSGARMVSNRLVNVPCNTTREDWRPAVGFPPTIAAIVIADAPWRAGAVWGS